MENESRNSEINNIELQKEILLSAMLDNTIDREQYSMELKELEKQKMVTMRYICHFIVQLVND